MPPFSMLAMDAGAGPVNAPITAAPVTIRVKAEGTTLFTVPPEMFVTVITNVVVLPGKRQAGLFVMATVKPQLKPAATVSNEDVTELEVLVVPEVVVQVPVVLAHAVNFAVPPVDPLNV